jgi:hypothetical protein
MKNFNELLEDLYASQYKIKKVQTQNPETGDWEWHDRKVRTKRIDFKSSKMDGKPSQEKNMKEENQIDELDRSTLKSYINKNIKTGRADSDKGDSGLYRATKKVASTLSTSTLDKKVNKLGNTSSSDNKNKYEYDASRSELKNRGTHYFGGKKFKEDTDMTIDEQINEVLSKDATAGDWIHDFVHSDNPKFDGKSQDKRKQMALAAYYAKQQNEEVDELTEESHLSLAKNAKSEEEFHSHMLNHHMEMMHAHKALDDSYASEHHADKAKKHADKLSKLGNDVSFNENAPVAPTLDRKYIKGTPENKAHKEKNKPINGHPTNVKENMKTFKEILQSIEEKISIVHGNAPAGHNNKPTTTSGVTSGTIYTGQRPAPSLNTKPAATKPAGKPDAKPQSALDRVRSGMKKTNEENISEKSDQAKQNKTIKNMMDASKGAQFNRASGLNMKPSDTGHETPQQMNKALGRSLRKEGMEDTLHPAGAALLKHIKPEHHNKYKPFLAKGTFNGSHKDRTDVLNAAKQAGHLNEAKDESEYGYEGDMAMSQLKTICRHSEEFMGMLKPDTDLPEWVQSKITLATDYIQTAHDYMMSEMNEELKGGQKRLDKNKNGKLDSHDFKILRGEDDMHESTCPVCHKSPCECSVKEGKQMKLRSGVVKMHPNGVQSDTEEGWETPEPAGGKTKKDFKESVEKRTISFSDFINEIKMADLPRRTIQGSSYGAQYRDPEGDDDAEDKKKQVAKSEPAVKRGRGRPAGSKSGANQKVTSGTKRTGVDYSGYKLHLPNSNR